jgi:hypothetical protein
MMHNNVAPAKTLVTEHCAVVTATSVKCQPQLVPIATRYHIPLGSAKPVHQTDEDAGCTWLTS